MVERHIPEQRVRRLNERPVRADGAYVLYWMIANRRPVWNFALDHAEAIAEELRRPLLVLEALRVDYRWACDRFHAFVVEGMMDNERAFANNALTYYPYLEPRPGAGKGLLAALGKAACCVVTDDTPTFFFPGMVSAAARAVPVRMEAVDAGGLIPLRAPDRGFARAYDFRRWIQRDGVDALLAQPRRRRVNRDRLEVLDRVPRPITESWPALTQHERGDRSWLAELPIEHDVGASDSTPGGRTAALRRLRTFVDERLPHYAEAARHPDAAGTSGLSPYLHFGHVAAHEVFAAVVDAEGWTPARIDESRADGRRSGWWGLSENSEAFLDQLITWRELGANTALHTPDHESYETLPNWARETLDAHANDTRRHVYDVDQLAVSATHDEIWNAAQTELRRTGRLHNYLRMLWGKKIVEWTPDPRTALETMIELNNRYALDGRDPNSYSGISWVLGRYDRPWGPEREIFGKVRYMSSESTRKKVRLKSYLERFGADVVAAPGD